jgi:hypothetical protein
MSDRSVELAKQSINGESKYNYFIVGIAAATFAYFGKDFIPNPPLGWNQSSVLLSGLVLLILSIVAGLKKIEEHNTLLRKNGKYLDFYEQFAAYKQNSIDGNASINLESGEVLTPDESTKNAKQLESLLPEFKSELDRRSTKISIYNNTRDYALFGGYILLGFSKFFPMLNT